MLLSLHLLFQVISCFPVFPSNPWFFLQNPFLIRQNSVIPWFLLAVPCTVCNGGGGGGVPWLVWRHTWPRTCFWSGVQFNLPTWFLILDPSPAPVTTGDWGAELCGSFVSRTSQRRLRFGILPTPVLAKGIVLFSLPWINPILIVQSGLSSLVFRPLREQRAENFCWSWQCLPCLSFLIIYHQARSAATGS